MIDIQILETPLSAATCIDYVNNADCGGISSFVGTVRSQTNGKRVVRLEFESYVPMAILELQKIVDIAKEKWGVYRVSVHHRVGVLAVGEIAVVIAVATPHRKNAFAACQYIIDTLKETVPIWKKEVFEDGEIWVAAHP